MRLSIRGRSFFIPDSQAFVSMYRDHFQKEIFRFETSRKSPLVLDCGANIGLVTLYFKSLFPEARIFAFEPDPSNFYALEQNCSHLSDVTILQSAVWTNEGDLQFSPAGPVGGHLSTLATGETAESVTVKSIRLWDYLDEPVDFLKLDIEGAEVDVLADCADRLENVERMFVEFHSFAGKPQRFTNLLQVIEDAGFRIHVHSSMEEPQPFQGIRIHNRKDLRVNLFCYRDLTRAATYDQ